MKLASRIKLGPATVGVATALFVANGMASLAFAEAPQSGKETASVLASHLSDKWIIAAELTLNTEVGMIYYHGSAQRSSPVTEPWRGKVKGDILYVSPHTAMVIPSGTLTVGHKDALKATGAHQTFVATPGKRAAWLGLLAD
jgi:hypothetical protein